jgi:hypothetical protein
MLLKKVLNPEYLFMPTSSVRPQAKTVSKDKQSFHQSAGLENA